jgi:hypothetical protein
MRLKAGELDHGPITLRMGYSHLVEIKDYDAYGGCLMRIVHDLIV